MIKYETVKINKRFFLRALIGFFIIIQMIMLSFLLVSINNNAVAEKTAAVQETTEQPVTQPAAPQGSTNIVDRFSLEGKDANSFSSGRVSIWERYVKELNLLGNNFDEYDIDKMTGGSIYPLAHNIFLEIGYRCGVPVGLLSVFLILVTGIMSLGYLFFNRDKKLYLLFPILCVITYAVEALLDCAALPFFQAEALFFYFAMIVFVDAKEVCRVSKESD